MNTLYIKVDAENPDTELIRRAAEVLKSGGLVAFPTETVYGLGADAQNADAVAKVYKAKNRPSDNPLIWHANSVQELEEAAVFSDTARKLAEVFWPGPLTLVLQSKTPVYPKTIAVRVPSHPVTRALIDESGCIIAAPSANTSGRPSPTRANHVSEDLDGVIEMIVDGGATQKGLESTVLDLHTGKARLLRPGAITLEMLREVIGEVALPSPKDLEAEVPISPGMKYRHYAPLAPVILVEEGQARSIARDYEADGKVVGVLETSKYGSLELAAKDLFDRLRRFDEQGVSIIIVETVPEEGIGLAIMNRLRKAASDADIIAT